MDKSSMDKGFPWATTIDGQALSMDTLTVIGEPCQSRLLASFYSGAVSVIIHFVFHRIPQSDDIWSHKV